MIGYTYSKPITHRIPVDRNAWEALRCHLGLHLWARWERMTGTLTEKQGRTKSEREVFIQVREAICCGLSQARHL